MDERSDHRNSIPSASVAVDVAIRTVWIFPSSTSALITPPGCGKLLLVDQGLVLATTSALDEIDAMDERKLSHNISIATAWHLSIMVVSMSTLNIVMRSGELR